GPDRLHEVRQRGEEDAAPLGYPLQEEPRCEPLLSAGEEQRHLEYGRRPLLRWSVERRGRMPGGGRRGRRRRATGGNRREGTADQGGAILCRPAASCRR